MFVGCNPADIGDLSLLVWCTPVTPPSPQVSVVITRVTLLSSPRCP